MIWSILVPAIPNRLRSGMAVAQFMKLVAMAADHPDVEVLMLADNKRRTVGDKRQALIEAARGDYVSFVDDDDWIHERYVEQLKPELLSGPDVVGFPIDVTIHGKTGPLYGMVEPSLRAPNEEIKALPEITRRKPAHLAVWKRSIALEAGFPGLMWGEDKVFMERACAIATREIFVPYVLYRYQWSEAISEAPNV